MVLKKSVNPPVDAAAVNAAADRSEAPWAEEEAMQGGPAAEAAAPAPAPAQRQAPVSVPNTSRALASTRPAHELDTVKNLKNAYTVNYDSLASLLPAQSVFTERETQVNLGSELILELLSYQDQYVCNPGTDKAPKDLLRFSSDGVTASDGTDMKEHLQLLKELGYDKTARIVQRYVIVGALNNAEKSDKFNGTLVQMDLSPKSKSQFDRYIIQSAFDIAKGRYTPEQVKVLRVTANPATNGAGQKYTLVKFETYVDA